MENVLQILILISMILFSVAIHEMSHAYASYFLGDDTAKLKNRLSLNPFRHLDFFYSLLMPLALAILKLPIFGGAKPVPVNPSRLRWGEYGMALVALAGPISNFVLAFIGFGIASIIKSEYSIYFLIFCNINLGFMFFNLIPIPPLDGSRVLYSLVPQSVKEIMLRIESHGILLVMVIVLAAHSLIFMYIENMIILCYKFFQFIFFV